MTNRARRTAPHWITRMIGATWLALPLVAGCATRSSEMMQESMMMKDLGPTLTMRPSPLARNAGLEMATGSARVNVQQGMVEMTVTLAPGTSLPAGTVLEGWLSSAGRKGGPGMSSASEADQKFGPAFGMPDVARQSRELPYALSTGLFRRQGNSQTYVNRFRIDNPLTPYAAVAVTLESDGNRGRYDPRPGTPLMDAMIAGAGR